MTTPQPVILIVSDRSHKRLLLQNLSNNFQVFFSREIDISHYFMFAIVLGCYLVWYCSRKCQVDHWSQHKEDCKVADLQSVSFGLKMKYFRLLNLSIKLSMFLMTCSMELAMLLGRYYSFSWFLPRLISSTF